MTTGIRRVFTGGKNWVIEGSAEAIPKRASWERKRTALMIEGCAKFWNAAWAYSVYSDE
jgi:hypothetical protein